MAQRSFEDRNIRSLTKTSSGKSYTVTIPVEYIRALGWRERQKLVVTLKGKTLTIKDWEK